MRYAIILLGMLVGLCACSKEKKQDDPALKYSVLEGPTMGTVYRIKLLDAQQSIRQSAIDSILLEVNMAASTYIDSSVISLFNRSGQGIALYVDTTGLNDRYDQFLSVFRSSERVAALSEGYYDPTVMPLVNYWGFGYTGHRPVETVDTTTVDSLLRLVGLDKLHLQRSADSSWFLQKETEGVQLDFSSIAKGFGVDMIAAYLEKRGVINYFVDIGGEIRTSGASADHPYWVAGVSTPDPGAAVNDIFIKLQLSNDAVATSGNYRNYYTVDGVEYGHTINPKTGWPEKNDLLSATVIADNCTLADAFATAFMAMGSKKALKVVDNLLGLEALFVVNEQGNYRLIYSKGFKKYILEDE